LLTNKTATFIKKIELEPNFKPLLKHHDTTTKGIYRHFPRAEHYQSGRKITPHTIGIVDVNS
jgi:hypothetical protein